MTSVTSYRSRKADFSDSDSSSSDDDTDQPWKRQRKARTSPVVVSHSSERPALQSSASSASNKRRRNNIWGQVVQQQEEEQVARDMTQFDMRRNKERDVESYDYRQADLQRKSQPLGNPISFDDSPGSRNRKMPSALGDSNEDSWLVDEADKDSGIKDRLGSKSGKEEEVEVGRLKFFSTMRRVTIRPNMHKKEIAGRISYSLQEPNRDMVKTVVDELGAEKAVSVWEQTRDIECNGGMLVNTGHRRRTPGGVFFQLLKTDPEITKENKDVIFAMSRFQSKVDSKQKRRRRRKRHSHEKGTKLEKASSMEVEVKQGEQTKSMDPGVGQEGTTMDLEMKQEEATNVHIALKPEEEGNAMDLEIKQVQNGGNPNKETDVGNGIDGGVEHGTDKEEGIKAEVGDDRKIEHPYEEEGSSSEEEEEEEEADIGKAIERRLLEIKRAKEKESGDKEMKEVQGGVDGTLVEIQNGGLQGKFTATVDKNRGGEDADMEEGEVSD